MTLWVRRLGWRLIPLACLAGIVLIVLQYLHWYAENVIKP
jgi:hypothetical protein